MSAAAPEAGLPRLYAIVDVEAAERTGHLPRDLGRAFLDGGARLIQLRAKAMASGALLDLAEAMAEDAAAAGGRLILNDRADLAVLARAAGVHVGQDDLPAADARRLVGADGLVGLSTHTPDQVRDAVTMPVSYVAVGPMFDTTTKATGYAAVGLPLVDVAVPAARAHGLPVVAIGGITLERAPRLIAAGVASVAVIGDLLNGDPTARARAFVSALR